MDEEDKKSALDLLYYELEMFIKTYEVLVSRPSELERKAFLESFLLHARNLVDFLEDRKYNSDIKCSDFGIDKIIVDLPAENSIDRINKYLAHITKERLKLKNPKWKYKEIKVEIDGKIKDFINKLPISIWPTKEEMDKSDFELLYDKRDNTGDISSGIIDSCSNMQS